MPYGDGAYQPYLFRRWSAHTHTYGNTGSINSGHNTGTSNISSAGGYGSGSSGSGAAIGLAPYPFSRRWSVPASPGQQAGSTTGCDLFKVIKLSTSFDFSKKKIIIRLRT